MSSYDLGPDLQDPENPSDLDVLDFCLRLMAEYAHPATFAVEFGVGDGTSLRLITSTGYPAIGFDSFAGLPEDWRPEFLAGHFAQIEQPEIPNAVIVPGLFADTLPMIDWPKRVGLIHFDADLYSSTATGLMYIGHKIDVGTILVFDEFHGFTDDFDGEDGKSGEERAWREHVEKYPMEWSVLGHGREQWAIQITKVGEIV